MPYFSFSNEAGFVYHATLEEARQRAQEELDLATDDPECIDHDLASSIVYGKVLGEALPDQEGIWEIDEVKDAP